MSSLYNKRGVSAQKEDVHKAVKKLDKGLFPNAFTKILPDLVANSQDFVNIMHADGAGTKSVLAYLYWKETGDLSVWKGIAQDAIVMNLDDILVAADVDKLIFSSTIGRNKNLIPGQVIEQIINGTIEFFEKMKQFDLELVLAGGETADVGDLVRTIIVDFTAFTRTEKSKVIEIDIQPDDLIVGFASYGQATYESEYNSGISSNGLTSARHDILNKQIAEKYPESFDPLIQDFAYLAQNSLLDIEPETGLTYGKLLLSPTRTYAPLLKQIYQQIDKSKIDGIIHCTGGGQTKVMKFVNNVHIIKDNLLPIPPIFKRIYEQSQNSVEEMFQVFNMGHRLEIYVKDEQTAQQLIDIAAKFNIEAKIIGKVQQYKGKKLTIQSEIGQAVYEYESTSFT